jgi:pilus assembly protein Flp/PilA
VPRIRNWRERYTASPLFACAKVYQADASSICEAGIFCRCDESWQGQSFVDQINQTFTVRHLSLQRLPNLSVSRGIITSRFAERKRAIMKKLLKNFIADESGATAIEYGLIAAGISLAIISVVNGLGTNLKTKFTSINTSLK